MGIPFWETHAQQWIAYELNYHNYAVLFLEKHCSNFNNYSIEVVRI